MIRFYVLMIKQEKMTIDGVPALWQQDVKKELDKQEGEQR